MTWQTGYFETLSKIHRDNGGVDGFPATDSTMRGTIDPMTDYSGRFNVRLPVGLHQALAEHAKQEGVSLNTAVVALIAGGLGYATPGRPVRLTKDEARFLRRAGSGEIETVGDYSGMSPAEIRAGERAIHKMGSVR